MRNLTKIGLMDNCIDGDGEKFNQLVGPMYDQFSCFFGVLKENGITELPEKISFEGDLGIAEFTMFAKVPLASTEQTIGVFGCKIAVTPSKQTTKVRIQARA